MYYNPYFPEFFFSGKILQILSVHFAKLINFHFNGIIIFKIFIQFSGTFYLTGS